MRARLTSLALVCCPGVLTPEECEQYLESVWGWLEGLGTGIDSQNSDTWGDDR